LNEPVTSVAVLSPSRRETYLVPPTPHPIPLHNDTIDSIISGITLNFDDNNTIDDFKENDFPPPLPPPIRRRPRHRLEDVELFLDDQIGTNEFDSELFGSRNSPLELLSALPSMSLAQSADGNGNEDVDNFALGLKADEDKTLNLRKETTGAGPQASRISSIMKPWDPDSEEDLEGELLDKAISQIDSTIAALKMKLSLK